MKGGGNFTVYDMLIGNPSFVVEKKSSWNILMSLQYGTQSLVPDETV